MFSKIVKNKTIKIFFVLIILLVNVLPVKAFFGFFNEKLSESKISLKHKKDPGELRFAFISDAYLYPVPVSQENFTKTPKSNVGIMYTESQVLLQELVRDLIKHQEQNQLDFVLFGGSNVANNYHWDLFLDIVDELSKNSIKYYLMVGDGEYLGSNAVEDMVSEKFWHKKIDGVNFLVLDNARDLTYIKELEWLNKKIQELENDDSDVYVFSYRPLSSELLEAIQTIPNLKLVANSYELKYQYLNPISSQVISQPKLPLNYIYLSNPPLSVYPCGYSIISRKNNGSIKIEALHSSLKGVRKKAFDELKSLGKDPKSFEYDFINVNPKWGLP